jgi:CBS domain containing-hemolysin-like protein
MSDSVFASPAPSASEATEEPPSWTERLRQFIEALWPRPPQTEALREAVEDLIEEQQTDSGAPTPEQTLLTNILNLRTREVGDCMIPRADIKAFDIEETPAALVALMAACKHSRIPIYRDTLDDVLGMIHMKDVLLSLADHRPLVLRDLLRPVLIVVPSMPASKLLLQMRQTRQHMAMVVDEFGGVDGLVTIEDLVEEIVGEIEDEHDAPATADIIARPDGTLLVDARLPIAVFEERIGAALISEAERGEIDTLGGFVFHIAGHIPKIGERLCCWAGYEFEILEADQNRIKRLRVRKTTPSSP